MAFYSISLLFLAISLQDVHDDNHKDTWNNRVVIYTIII